MFWKTETFNILEKPSCKLSQTSRDLYYSYYKKSPIIYRAINFISLNVSKFEIKGINEESDKFIKQPTRNDKSVNFNTLLYFIVNELLIYGDVFLLKDMNKISLLNSKKVNIVVDENEEIIKYKISDKFYDKNEIIHIKYGFSKSFGISPMHSAQLSIEISLEISKYLLSLLQTGCRPSGILTLPTSSLSIDKSENINKIRRIYENIGVNNDIAIIDGKIDWQKIGESIKDLDLLEKKSAAEREILGCFNLQPILLDLSFGNATFSNYEIAVKQFYNEVVYPMLNNILRTISFAMFNQNLFKFTKEEE